MRQQAAQETTGQCVTVSCGCSLLLTAPLLQHWSSTACSLLVRTCPGTGSPWATVPPGCPCPSVGPPQATDPQGCPCPGEGGCPSRVPPPAQSASFQESISSQASNHIPNPSTCVLHFLPLLQTHLFTYLLISPFAHRLVTPPISPPVSPHIFAFVSPFIYPHPCSLVPPASCHLFMAFSVTPCVSFFASSRVSFCVSSRTSSHARPAPSSYHPF